MYERLIKSMRGFQAIREKDRVALINGELPPAQQRRMDSIIKQAMRIGEPMRAKIIKGMKSKIIELEQRLTIDILNPNRRAHIIELLKRIEFLDEGQHHLNTIIEERDKQIQQLALANKSLRDDVAHQLRQHYETCESEGLTWDGDIPEKPKDY